MQAEIIPLEKIAESPTNPRRLRNEAEDAELIESVKRHGVLQAVLVRPKPPGGYELVVGSRRYRAALAAGLAEIPASVRAMSDLEVLEVQVIENSQRADVHPLEEAEAFERLHNAHGLSVDEIAAKLGKSKGFVYARMKLCALGKEGRAAFYDGKLEASVALLVARIPAKLQAEAVSAVTREDRWNGRMTARQAADHIHRSFMLELREAPFPTDDAELVPAAGACSACPKRTGNQPELFGDVKSADVCTDPICFRKKADANWARRKEEAERDGRKALEGKRAEAFSRTAVDLDSTCWEDPKNRTYRKVLGADAPEPVLVRSERGEVRELVPQALATAALRAAGVRAGSSTDSRGRTEAQRTKDEILRRLAERAIAGVVERAPALPKLGILWWRWLAKAVVHASHHESRKAAGEARSLGGTKRKGAPVDWSKDLEKWVTEAAQDDAISLVVELLVRRDAFGSWREDIGDALKGGCAFAGVDLKKLRADVAAEVGARNAERRKKAAKKGARAEAPAKRKAAAKPRRKATKKRGAA